MTIQKGLPDDWQEQTLNAIIEMRRSDPSESVFGLRLPTSWLELASSARNGDLQRMLNVKVVTFGSDRAIERLYPPGTEKTESKPKARK